MKKKSIILIIIASVIIAAAASVIFLMRQEKLFVRTPVLVLEKPVVTYILGEAEIFDRDKNGESIWLPLEIGQDLKKSDTVRTLAGSDLDIRFSNKTVIRLQENTTVSIETLTIKRLDLGINKGTVFAKFEKLFKEQTFGVNTATAAAGVRGTELVFEVDEDETRITALSGITEIYNPQFPEDKILLSYQKKSSIKKGTPPTEPENISQKELDEIQRTMNSIHSEKVLLVSSRIQFGPDSDEILPSSFEELDNVVKQLSKNNYYVRIEGHTANAGSPSAMYNLSVRRAEKIMDYLVEHGISPKRLSTQGYGGTRPLTDDDTAEGRAMNRRVEFVIVD